MRGVAGKVGISWDLVLENTTPVAPCDADAHHILAALEQQLAALDRLGSHIAAAHLDAAIQQLRLDQARR
jgi:hypothetical protein